MKQRDRHLSFVLMFCTLLCVFRTDHNSVRASESSTIRSLQQQQQTPAPPHDLCADLVDTTWRIGVTQRESPQCPNLTVWVPQKPGFNEFIRFNAQGKVEGGFSIAIFCYALQLIPYQVQPIFETYRIVDDKGESNGSYDGLLKDIQNQNKICMVAAGDISIRANRIEYVDFTIPYMGSAVYMLVRGAHEWNQTLWTFLKPFTWRLWVTLVCVCIFVGLTVAILEYRVGNPRFVTPFYRKFIMVLWFPISTFFFNEGKIVNKHSKVVLVMWLSMIFMVVQIFTACLSSWLTLDQLRPKLPTTFEHIGFQEGSFVKQIIEEQYNSSSKCPTPLKGVYDFKNAMSNGSVSAVIDEHPYIEVFLSKYGSEYMKVGPIKEEAGIGFAFPKGSPLLNSFSEAIIKTRESDFMTEMQKRYLGFRTINQTEDTDQLLPQSLDVQSFIALFVLLVSGAIAAIISSEISLMRTRNKILPVTSLDYT